MALKEPHTAFLKDSSVGHTDITSALNVSWTSGYIASNNIAKLSVCADVSGMPVSLQGTFGDLGEDSHHGQRQEKPGGPLSFSTTNLKAMYSQIYC